MLLIVNLRALSTANARGWMGMAWSPGDVCTFYNPWWQPNEASVRNVAVGVDGAAHTCPERMNRVVSFHGVTSHFRFLREFSDSGSIVSGDGGVHL